MKPIINSEAENKGLYKKVSSALNLLNTIQQKIFANSDKTTKNVENSPMICPSTGALNRIGLRKYFDQILPSALPKVSIIYIELDYFDENIRLLAKNKSDKNLQQFVGEVIDICGPRDLIARWNDNEFVLVCPEFPQDQAIKLANTICITVNNNMRKKGIEFRCNAAASQVNEEDLHYLISSTKQELHKGLANKQHNHRQNIA